MGKASRRRHSRRHMVHGYTAVARVLDEQMLELAVEGDRLWFEAHPQASTRIRDYVKGEFPAHDPGIVGVLVRQIRPGVRVREAVFERGSSDRDIRPAVVKTGDDGEVLGIYSDEPMPGDDLARRVRALLARGSG